MIPGAALADWLADGDAQRRSYAAVKAFSDRCLQQPLVPMLEREISELGERTPEALLAAARRFMDKTDALDTMMREMIALSRADPFFRPPFQPLSSEVQSSLLLYHHADLSISLGVASVDLLAAKKSERAAPQSINFTGYVSLMRFLKAGGATLSFWEAPPMGEDFVATEGRTCRLVERRRIEDGEEIVVDGRHRSFVIEHATGDMLIFQAIVRAGCAPVAAEYDYDSGRFIAASSTDEASSRVQMMVSLLRAMDREDAFPLFEEALRSPQFYTRWYVMREMLAMDADAALPSLRAMAAGDPHPDVRAAARQALELFFEEEEAAPAAAGDLSCRA